MPLGRQVPCALALALATLSPLAAADGDLIGSALAAFDLGGPNADVVSGVAVQKNGAVLVVGSVTTGAATWQDAIARFLPDGTLDSSFGTGGRLVNPFGFLLNSVGTAIQVLADDRILVAGTIDYGGGDQDFWVGRLLENGLPDVTFGAAGGVAWIAFDVGGDHTDTLSAMTLDRNGRINLVGSVDVSSTDIDIGVARLTADGLPSLSFSVDGKTTVPISPQSPDYGLALAIDNDGRILIAGATWIDVAVGNFDQVVVALTSTGDVDTSFATGGSFIIGWNAGGDLNDFLWGIGVWPDNEIVVAGDFATDNNSWRSTMLRLSQGGAYIDGINFRYCDDPNVICGVTPRDSIRALLLQGDDKIVVAGFGITNPDDTDFGIARFQRNLFPDSSFAGDGTTTATIGNVGHADTGVAATFDRDGRLIVAGSYQFSGLDTDFGWARFDSSYIFADGFDWPGGWLRWSGVVP